MLWLIQHLLNAESNIDAEQSKIVCTKKEIDALQRQTLEKMKYIQALEIALTAERLRFKTALEVAMQLCPEKIAERWKTL